MAKRAKGKRARQRTVAKGGGPGHAAQVKRTGQQSSRAKAESTPAGRLALALAAAADETKVGHVRILDVRRLTDVTDFMVLATAGSERQLRALARCVEEACRRAGERPLGVEGTEASGWIVVDAGDVVAHLMGARARDYYDLDGLWADAREVERPTASTAKNAKDGE
jgi:ribosome-associated protein